MNELQQYVDGIEAQYKENLWKVNIGVWDLQQWYDYCTAVLGDLMLIQDKQTKQA